MVVRSTVVGVVDETVVLVVVVDGASSRVTLIQPLIKVTVAKAKARLMLRKRVIDFIDSDFN